MKVNSNAVNLLRAAGILYIVGFWHLMNYVKGFPGYMNEATYGLTVTALASFTILSGYLLGLKSVSLDRDSLLNFYKRRLIRIYPPMVFAVILLVGTLFFDVISGLKSILLLGAIIPPAPATIWYISMLVLFYAIAPFMICVRDKGILPYVAMTFGASAVMLALHAYIGLFDPRTIIYLPCFAIGIAVARGELQKPAWLIALLAVATLLSYMYCLTTPPPEWEVSVTSLPFAAFSSWLILLIVFKLPLPKDDVSWIKFLASASLFMYLFHRVFYRLFKFVLGGLPDPYIGLAAMYLIGLPAIIVLSWFGQRFYDREIVPRLTMDHPPKAA